jgi:8-oxo-dGTP diphosphatase
MKSGEVAQGVDGTRYTVVPRVVCFLRCGEELLLLKGAPDKRLWAGLYNGVGGHVERDEDPYQAARLEIREETGLEVADLHLAGIVHVSLADGPGVLIFLFTAEAPSRELRPSSEGALEWVTLERLAGLPVVGDLPVFLPRLLKAAPGEAPFFARSFYRDGRLRVEFSQPG